MGTVYLAYDPQLDRNLAIKVLRDSRAVEGEGPARLLREARALAKLSHPNVVDIYDVGASDMGVYIAMEFVDGKTLDVWIKTERPNAEAILKVCIGAGRGVAAAHTQGFVHRDLKPSNILVSIAPNSRRTKGLVVDFGLARLASTSDSEQRLQSKATTIMDDPPAGENSADLFESPLTEEGTVVGTPAYMSPEQRAGRTPDIATDQYSFCVTVFQALFGYRPDQSPTVRELNDSLRPQPTTADRSLHAKVRPLLERGLQQDPERRFRSMHELLHALEKAGGSKAERVWYASIALGTVGCTAVGLALYAPDPGKRPQAECAGAQLRLTGIWDAQQKQALREVFAAIPKAFASESWALAEGRLDEHAAAWLAAYTDACEATHVLGTQSGTQLDARMRCLETRRVALEATVTALHETDADTAKLIIPQINGLEPVSSCSDVDALLANVTPVTDPDKAQRVQRLRARIQHAEAWRLAGKHKQAHNLALTIDEDARAVGYSPVEAEAAAALGRTLHSLRKIDPSVESLTRAHALALESGHDVVAIKVAMQLVSALAAERSRFDDALSWSRHARASLDRYRSTGGYQTEYLEAQFLFSMGMLHVHKGEYKPAKTYFLEALEAKRKLLGESHVEVAAVLKFLGFCEHFLDNTEKSHAYFTQSISIRRAALGDHHPQVMNALVAFALVKKQVGQLDDAEALYEEALEIAKGSVGLDHPDSIQALENTGFIAAERGNHERAVALATEALDRCHRTYSPTSARFAACHSALAYVYSRHGDHEQAHPHFVRAYEIGREALGPEHPGTAQLQTGVGISLTEMKRYNEAQIQFESAMKIRQIAFGENHPEVANSQHSLGEFFSAQKRYQEALHHYQRSLEIYTISKGADHPAARFALSRVGAVLLELDRPTEAADTFRRALAPVGADASAPGQTPRPEITAADAQFGLARALVKIGGDRNEARKLAEKSLATFLDEDGPGFEQSARDVETWLAAQ